MLLKQGRGSKETTETTRESENGCLDIFYAHIEGLGFSLADRARAKQTWSGSACTRESSRRQSEELLGQNICMAK